MNKVRVLVATAITLAMTTTGYTAGSNDEGTTDSPPPMTNSEGMQGMTGGMHGKGMMHQGMMGHHMMHSGVSPVTIVVQPGMMPMMEHGMTQHGMMQGGAKSDHKCGAMGQGRMEQRQGMMKKHMELMEQRLANIEKLLGELVELQRND